MIEIIALGFTQGSDWHWDKPEDAAPVVKPASPWRDVAWIASVYGISLLIYGLYWLDRWLKL